MLPGTVEGFDGEPMPRDTPAYSLETAAGRPIGEAGT